MVAGAYFYTRHRVQNVLKHVPEKMGLEFKQTANGFSVSKSELGRTIFKIEASKAVQYKRGGQAELHDVHITLYGSDSSRFDQIYGKDFLYDQQTGDVESRGEVDMDLESNPAGITSPDQASPKELKNPVHLKTEGLVFNQKTGDAHTEEKVEFSVSEASGSAMGMSYLAKTSVLTLVSRLEILINGEPEITIKAHHAEISKDPHIVVLEEARVTSGLEQSDADQVTIFLRPDNSVERLLARGHVLVESKGEQPAKVRSDQLEAFLSSVNGPQNDTPNEPTNGVKPQRLTVRSSILSGNVQFETLGSAPMQGSSERAILNFSNNSVEKIHADGNVKLAQHQKSASGSANYQDFELTAPVVDFFLVDGKHFARAETSGPPQITIRSTPQNSSIASSGQTVITAGKFDAKFDDLGQLSSVHGEPETRIASTASGQPNRVSTSLTLDAAFTPGSGIQTITQQGNFAYTDGERKAWAEHAHYTPASQVFLLTGSPRIVDRGMTTTARTVRMNRATGDGFAEGDVKSTYSDLKANPNGALLSSSSPIHVTAGMMTAHRSPAVALYEGGARLWQDGNSVQAPSIEFDRDQRSMDARSSLNQKVSTVLVQLGKDGKATSIRITSDHLTYADNDRRAHFEGGVVAKGEDLTITAAQMDTFLQARDQVTGNQSLTYSSKLDKIIAWDHVILTQPSRHATGEQLKYTATDDKFVLTGGPPSIFDAEHGKVTGVSLTMFRGDDRVLVVGSDKSLAITETRVAR